MRGVLWRDGASCCISEYSWKGIKPEQEYFVLNGHLWGMQALLMLADASGDKALKEAYACGRRGMIERLQKFYNSAGNWTRYMLVPKVINPTHYNVLELAQFKALEAITNDEVYREPVQRRAGFFRNAYALFLVKTGTGLQIQFSMMGAPNAYWTDAYPVTVSCKVGRKTVSAVNSDVYSKKPMAERMILRLPVSAKPEICSVSVRSNVSVQVYEQKQFDIAVASPKSAITISPQVELLASNAENNSINIRPSEKDGEGGSRCRSQNLFMQRTS